MINLIDNLFIPHFSFPLESFVLFVSLTCYLFCFSIVYSILIYLSHMLRAYEIWEINVLSFEFRESGRAREREGRRRERERGEKERDEAPPQFHTH